MPFSIDTKDLDFRSQSSVSARSIKRPASALDTTGSQRAEAVRMREELDALIADGDRARAIRRLLDYARDYACDRVRKNEAVMLSSRWNAMRDERRKLGSSAELERRENELTEALLSLADRILDERPVPAVAPQIQPDPAAKPSVSYAAAAAPGNQAAGELTRLERAREGVKRPSPVPVRDLQPPGVAVRCRGAAARYGNKLVLSGVDLDLRYGQVTAIVGINGAGKSTLLRLIAGELLASDGHVGYYGIGGSTRDRTRIRQKIGYVRQQPPTWYGPIIDNLELSAARAGAHGRENTEMVDFFLQRLGLDAYRDMKWSELSGGFKMRCELALVLVTEPDILVLDEPLAPLDIVAQQRFLQDLRDLADSKTNPLPIVVTSQHLHEVESVADQMVVVDSGKVTVCGRKEIGANREENLFELICPLDREHLENALKNLSKIEISRFGSKWIIQTPLSVTRTALLQTLLSAGVSPELFHDVSCSARRFFGRALEDE